MRRLNKRADQVSPCFVLRKKGSSWMTEETGKFLISVLVIVLLIMLIVKLVSLFTTNTEYEQAKATLEEITSYFDKLEVSKRGYYLIESPFNRDNNWFIVFDNNEKLCICKGEENKVDLPSCFNLKEKNSVCKKVGKVTIPLPVMLRNPVLEKVDVVSASYNSYGKIPISSVPLLVSVFKVSENEFVLNDNRFMESGKSFFKDFSVARSTLDGKEMSLEEQILYYYNAGTWDMYNMENTPNGQINVPKFIPDTSLKGSLQQNIDKYKLSTKNYPSYIAIYMGSYLIDYFGIVPTEIKMTEDYTIVGETEFPGFEKTLVGSQLQLTVYW